MNQKYTDAQVTDITAREKEAVDFLKKIQMTVSAQVVSVNVGDNTFAQKVVPYLADMKYTEQEGDVKSDVMTENKGQQTQKQNPDPTSGK